MQYRMLRLPCVYSYSQPTCPDLCKSPVKSDNSLRYWHLILCLLYFFLSVIFNSQILYFTESYPSWYDFMEVGFAALACLLVAWSSIEEGVQKSMSEGALVIPVANSHIICRLKIFVHKTQGQATYCVAGSVQSAQMPSSFLLVLFIRSTCIWLNSI